MGEEGWRKRKGGVPVRCLSASGWMENGRKSGREGRGRVGGGSMGEEGKEENLWAKKEEK